MGHHIELGAYEIHTPIGRGGMGEVWQGVHSGQGVEVAVKVLQGTRAQGAEFIDAFHNEVRAVAGMSHPGIVMVFDHGEISAEVEARSGGYFCAGSPYLVMEYASRGTLEHLTGPMPWTELRTVLLALLDALSHAHARGVVHRDLKPANILLASDTDARPGLKLTDFGIAHAVDRRSEAGQLNETVGTPRYMAPEQFKGQWRDFGPWTDLYALGCVAFQLICGVAPFEGELMQLIRGHLKLPPPPLTPLIEVPPGIEAWIHRLLSKTPAERFVRAADAAWALIQIDGERGRSTAFEAVLKGERAPEVSVDLEAISALYDLNLLGGLDGGETVLSTQVVAEESVGSLVMMAVQPAAGGSSMSHEAPPTPFTWRRPQAAAPSMRLVGAGLGLYGLRAIDLVGRLDERDAIWGALREVRASARPRLLLFEGAAGVGKSQLVQWMCERAHELGAATLLRANHSATGGPADGLGRMMARHLRCVGLTHEEAFERALALLGDSVDAHEVRGLAHVMVPAKEAPFSSPSERYALLRRLLERFGRERPVIVWLDDIQWGRDALDFAKALMASADEAARPILMLLTARTETLQEEASTRRALAELMAFDEARAQILGPLPPEDHEALVRELLGLESELVRQVAERTAGNPLFAVQLVGDWVHRGGLELGAGGFELREGEDAILPDDIHQVWRAHLARLLEGHPESVSVTLEVAAVLGKEVVNSEWQRACTQAGIPLTVQLLFTLFSARLAVPAEEGWCFAHGMLRESLLRVARDAGRLASHHGACAKMLSAEGWRASPGVAERIGWHCLEAGDCEAALEPLLIGAHYRSARDEYALVYPLLAARQRALEGVDAAEDDLRHTPALLISAELARLTGRFEAAQRDAERACQIADSHGDTALKASAEIEVAQLAVASGDMKAAGLSFSSALAAFEVLGDDSGQARAINGLGEVAFASGELSASEVHHERALEIYQRLGDPSGLSRSCIHLARIYERAEKWAWALGMYERALASCQARGERFQIGVIHNGLGEIHRFQGHLEDAEREYRAGLVIQRAIGNEQNELMTWVNLALVLISRGEHRSALRALDSVRVRFERSGWTRMVSMVHVFMLPCVAALGDWGTWAGHFGAAVGLSDGAVYPDEASALEEAGAMARAAGHTEWAREAYLIAQHWWGTLARPDKEAEINAALEALAAAPR